MNPDWKYPDEDNGRDLRIDFLRGFIMLYVIIVHFEYYSLFSTFAWGRLALISSAEGFVFLSGMVLGIVSRRRIARQGFSGANLQLWKRALTLYKANVVVISSIALLMFVPFIDTFELTHWTNPVSKDSYYLFPDAGTDWKHWISSIFLLQVGAHQYQIIGLYIILLLVAPAALYLLQKKQAILLIVISCAIYGINHYFHLNFTGTRHELAFPTLTWQLLFFVGMALGYHHKITLGFIIDPKNRWLVITAALFSLSFFFLACNNPSDLFWPWGHLEFIKPGDFYQMKEAWFRKTPLGLGRLLNNAVLFIVAYYLLTYYWLQIKKMAGWLLIPLGQNSLYVFTMHIYFILIVENTGLPQLENFLVNTALHAFVILSIWYLVKKQFLFNIVPR